MPGQGPRGQSHALLCFFSEANKRGTMTFSGPWFFLQGTSSAPYNAVRLVASRTSALFNSYKLLQNLF